MKEIKADYKDEQIDYELFVRTIAMLLELRNLSDPDHSKLQIQDEEDELEEKNWYNQEGKWCAVFSWFLLVFNAIHWSTYEYFHFHFHFIIFISFE